MPAKIDRRFEVCARCRFFDASVFRCTASGFTVLDKLASPANFCIMHYHDYLSRSRLIQWLASQLEIVRGRARRILYGVEGLAAWWNNWSPVDPATVRHRGVVCVDCLTREKRWFGYICGICRCLLFAKIRVGWEQCPKGRWPAIDQRPDGVPLPILRSGGCGGCSAKQ